MGNFNVINTFGSSGFSIGIGRTAGNSTGNYNIAIGGLGAQHAQKLQELDRKQKWEELIKTLEKL